MLRSAGMLLISAVILFIAALEDELDDVRDVNAHNGSINNTERKAP
jgi:hypothetical protein